MKILTALTYYAPHISGLTVYGRRVVRAMVERGHEVTVLTSHYDKSLPREEIIDGARVVRVPVLLRFSKGVLMPTLPWHALQLTRSHDVVYLHLPQFEASITAIMARVSGKPIVTMHHCDVLLPNRTVRALFWLPIASSHHIAARLSNQVVASSRDYAEHSPFLHHFMHKLVTVFPPTPDLQSDPSNPLNLRERYGLNNCRVVGFVGRLAEDKGVHYLIDAIPQVLERFPDVRFLLVGEQEKVIGETVYERLRDKIAGLGEHVLSLGVLPDSQLAEFYAECEMLVLPSINSTEAFGMVQVEAMLKGVPVIATDLPGVRVAISASGMGEIIPPRDSQALADAIIRVMSNRAAYVKPAAEINRLFDPNNTYDFYEKLFAQQLEAPSSREAGQSVGAGGRTAR